MNFLENILAKKNMKITEENNMKITEHMNMCSLFVMKMSLAGKHVGRRCCEFGLLKLLMKSESCSWMRMGYKRYVIYVL